MPELAKKITIDRKAGHVYIDGVEFPWYVHEDGPTVTGTGTTVPTIVHLPVFTEDIEIIPRGNDD